MSDTWKSAESPWGGARRGPVQNHLDCNSRWSTKKILFHILRTFLNEEDVGKCFKNQTAPPGGFLKKKWKNVHKIYIHILCTFSLLTGVHSNYEQFGEYKHFSSNHFRSVAVINHKLDCCLRHMLYTIPHSHFFATRLIIIWLLLCIISFAIRHAVSSESVFFLHLLFV